MVLDLFSRKVVGWAIDRRCEAALVNDALAKASGSRPTRPGTVIHSDHGTQFTSWSFTENVRRLGLVSSMGTVGDCYDNAPMESFWGSMQVELLDRQKWRTNLELAVAMADYIDHFYNSTGDTARSVTSPRTSSKRPTYHPPSRPLCPKKWSTEWGQALMERRTGIEPASSPWKGEALPLSYRRVRAAGPRRHQSCRRGCRTAIHWRHVAATLVGEGGFEPPTACPQSRCATGLRYSPSW